MPLKACLFWQPTDQRNGKFWNFDLTLAQCLWNVFWKKSLKKLVHSRVTFTTNTFTEFVFMLSVKTWYSAHSSGLAGETGYLLAMTASGPHAWKLFSPTPLSFISDWCQRLLQYQTKLPLYSCSWNSTNSPLPSSTHTIPIAIFTALKNSKKLYNKTTKSLCKKIQITYDRKHFKITWQILEPWILT